MTSTDKDHVRQGVYADSSVHVLCYHDSEKADTMPFWVCFQKKPWEANT